VRNSTLTIAVLLSLCVLGAAQETNINQVRIKRTSWASGQEMYHEYCAACHGPKADGRGPAASACQVNPPNLTTLAKRYGGKFPYDHFYSVLQFGTPTSTPAHGSADMPIWFLLFSSLDQERRGVSVQRMHNIARYVASLQAK